MEQGHTVVDFGCGGGVFCFAAADLVGEEGIVYALDRDESQLVSVAREAEARGLTNVRTRNTGGGVDVPLRDKCCDVMLLFDVLQMVDDWDRLFAESYRILKPAGKLAIFPMHVQPEQVCARVKAAGFSEERRWRCLLRFAKQGA